MYNCRCKAGFKGDGFTCKAAELEACRDDFGTKLQKIKIKDIKNPVSFAGDNVMVMEMQTQELFSQINIIQSELFFKQHESRYVTHGGIR